MVGALGTTELELEVELARAQQRVLEHVATGASLTQALDEIVAMVDDLARADASGMIGSILLLDAARGVLRAGAARNLPIEYVAAIDGLAIGPDAGSCGAAAYLGERVIATDIATDPRWVRFRDLALPHGLVACWSTPIRAPSGEVVGTFAMYHRTPRGPSPEEERWVVAATHLAAIAIHHARAIDAVVAGEARARQLGRVHAVSASVHEALVRVRDPQALYLCACQLAVEHGVARLAWVGLYDDADDRLDVVARSGIGATDGYVDEIIARLRADTSGPGPAARALRTGEVAPAHDLAAAPGDHEPAASLARGLRACVALPVRHDATVRGVLVIYGAQPGWFGVEEIQIMRRLADDLSFAIASARADAANRRLARELGERTAQLERLQRLHAALGRVNQAVVRVRSRDELYADVVRTLVEDGGFAMAWIGTWDRATDRVAVAASHGDVDDYLGRIEVAASDRPEGRGPTGSALRLGSTCVCADFVADPTTAPWRDAATRSGWRSSAAIPFRRGDEIVGALSVYSREVDALGAAEVALLEEVASDLSFALDHLDRDERLRQYIALARMAGRTAHLGGWRLDLPDAVTWSDEVCAIFDLPAGTRPIRGEALSFVVPEYRDALLAATRACERDGTPFEHEFELITARGRRAWARITGVAERDASGAIMGLHGAMQDISAHRRLEEQLRQAQKMEAVGQLAGGVAHDFNNLLTVILSYAAMLLDQLPPDDPLRGDVEEIAGAGRRAADVTAQLLAFSRRQVLHPRVVDVDQAIADLAKMMRPLLGDAVRLAIVAAPVPARVSVDPGQLGQVLLNLAVNARDAMPGGGALTLETAVVELDADAAAARELTPGSYVTIAMTDTGIGMDATTRRHLFEPFFTTKPQGKGTGLGLSTAYGIVTQSGGRIEVDSEAGAGATFRIWLPRVVGPTDAPGDRTVPGTLRGHETVLVVDDDPAVRQLVRTVLRRAGYVVIDADNPGDALLVAEQHAGAIALLLTDVVMPRMTGAQLADRIAARRPRMRVLFMSGYAEDTVTRLGGAGAGAGNDAHAPFELLPKPLTPEPLLRKVREVLDRPDDGATTAPSPA